MVVRIRDDRVFYTHPADPEPGTTGRPRRHGQRRGCAEPESWPDPDHESVTTDDRYGTVHVTAWGGLHPRLGCRGHWADHDQPPIVSGTVVCVDVEHLPKPTSRTKKTLWLWVAAGAGTNPDLEVCWRAYLRRFDIEHTFRFLKNTLGWTTPRLCTPNRPTSGPGSSSPPTPNCAWPAAWSKTNDCPGNAGSNPAGSPPPASDEGFGAPPPHWAPQPVHQNPADPAPDAPKAAAPGHAPATPRSKRPPDQPTKGLIASSGRSIEERNVTAGKPRMVDSSAIVPESDSTQAALICSRL